MIAGLVRAESTYAQADHPPSTLTVTATIDNTAWPRPSDDVSARAWMYEGDTTLMIQVDDRKGERWELLWFSVPRVRGEGSYGNYGAPDGWNAVFHVYLISPGVPNREIEVCGVTTESVGALSVSKIDWQAHEIQGSFTFRVPCFGRDRPGSGKSTDSARTTFKGDFSGRYRVEQGSRQIGGMVKPQRIERPISNDSLIKLLRRYPLGRALPPPPIVNGIPILPRTSDSMGTSPDGVPR